MITITNFSKSFEDREIYRNFSCTFDGQKINAIMGPSGSGKTTLLNAIAGFLDFEGKIDIDGVIHENKSTASVSYVFQEPRLIPQKTVFANLDFALKSAFKDKLERKERILEMLSGVDLSNSVNQYPSQLSGGMAQRVSLARAFLFPSDILLLDEPFKGLDDDLKSVVLSCFHDLWHKDTRTTLFVTHDKCEAERVADKIYTLPNKPIEKVVSEIDLTHD